MFIFESICFAGLRKEGRWSGHEQRNELVPGDGCSAAGCQDSDLKSVGKNGRPRNFFETETGLSVAESPRAKCCYGSSERSSKGKNNKLNNFNNFNNNFLIQ